MMDKIKAFNYKNIYNNQRLIAGNKYFELVINEIYEYLVKLYNGENTLEKLKKESEIYPKLIKSFMGWIVNLWNLTDRSNSNLKNKVLFDMSKEEDYKRAVVYFISGMTDRFAMDAYNEIICF